MPDAYDSEADHSNSLNRCKKMESFNGAVGCHAICSLKSEWLFKAHQSISEHMGLDVVVYIKYYNLDGLYRLHSNNDDLSPARF